MVKTIKFNVGGMKYEISKSLLDLHPNTMLARSASEQWQKDANSEIFIDRDGTLFQFVLNYLRDGSMYLPVTVRKAAVLNELKYYGVEDICEEKIDVSQTQGVVAFKSLREQISSIDDTIKKGDCAWFAKRVIESYASKAIGESPKSTCSFYIDIPPDRKIDRNSSRSLNKEMKVVNSILNKVGLHLKENNGHNGSRTVVVKVESI